MAADHLVDDALGDVGEVEGPGLLGHSGVEHDLEQQVAEFALEVGEVAAFDGVGHLIGFLDGVGRDGREGLFKVPGTTVAGRAQTRHDRQQAVDRRLGHPRLRPALRLSAAATPRW